MKNRRIITLLVIAIMLSAIFAAVAISSYAADGDVTVNIEGKNYTIPADKIGSGAVAAVFARSAGSTNYTFLKTITKVMDSFSDEAQKPLSSTYAGGEIYIYAWRLHRGEGQRME